MYPTCSSFIWAEFLCYVLWCFLQQHKQMHKKKAHTAVHLQRRSETTFIWWSLIVRVIEVIGMKFFSRDDQFWHYSCKGGVFHAMSIFIPWIFLECCFLRVLLMAVSTLGCVVMSDNCYAGAYSNNARWHDDTDADALPTNQDIYHNVGLAVMRRILIVTCDILWGLQAMLKK